MAVGYKEQKAAWEAWLGNQKWNIFGTLNFNTQSHLRSGNADDICGKMWRSYFTTIDRAIFGHQHQTKARVERVVFIQTGANSTNPHVHFLAKSYIDTDEQCILMSAVWSSAFSQAASPQANSITPVLNRHQAARYGLHELSKLGTATFDHRLSTFSQTEADHYARSDAEIRLINKANISSINKAIEWYPAHVAKAHEKR